MWKTTALLAAAASGGLMIPAMHNWVADLSPTPGHRITGTATFNGDTKDLVKVSLTLENATPNSTVTWHVHKGACSVPDAAIEGRESSYAPVQADGSGRVNTTVNLPMNLNDSGYSVRVHEKADSSNRQDYYQRDTTMQRDTAQDTTMQRPQSMPSWQNKDKGSDVAACGDLRPQGTEKANRQ